MRLASGHVPINNGQIWAYEAWEGIEVRFSLKLGRPSEALPLNDPPSKPYTMVPRSSVVQVTKENEHLDALLMHVPRSGYGLVYATFHERVSTKGSTKPHVEARIDDVRIGQLTPQMSERFLPMVRHLSERGLDTACWADIAGSRVAAEVRIDCLKANEVDDEVLNGPPSQLPRLVSQLADPWLYELSGMVADLRPWTVAPTVDSAEPPDGSVVRFTKGRRYNYVAVRRGSYWHTTATMSGGVIDQAMAWQELAQVVPSFEIATNWHQVANAREFLRSASNGQVVRFTVQGQYLVSLCVRAGHQDAGDWYTTIVYEEGSRLPLGSYAEWQDIAEYGQHVQAAGPWVRLG